MKKHKLLSDSDVHTHVKLTVAYCLFSLNQCVVMKVVRVNKHSLFKCRSGGGNWKLTKNKFHLEKPQNK